MGKSVKQAEWSPTLPAMVEYDPIGQILRIENGENSEVGEEMAEDVIVHYDNDDDCSPTSVVAIRIDRAEHVLKPFVDAILAKYGLKPVGAPAGE